MLMGSGSRAAGHLPYAPEYGFLRKVPPNAIAGPGYVFVTGVAIPDASCDLPSQRLH
jgi:hypothetical protein